MTIFYIMDGHYGLWMVFTRPLCSESSGGGGQAQILKIMLFSSEETVRNCQVTQENKRKRKIKDIYKR